MIKEEKSDHSETISNRFLMSKLVCRMICDIFDFRILFIKGTDDQNGDIFIFVLFLFKGTDDQIREVPSFWNYFQSIPHVQISLEDDFRQI